MSKAVRIKLNTRGIREFLRGDDVKAIVQQGADLVASRAEGNYDVEVIRAGTRYIATVEAADARTRHENLKNNTLLRAIGDGGGS